LFNLVHVAGEIDRLDQCGSRPINIVSFVSCTAIRTHRVVTPIIIHLGAKQMQNKCASFPIAVYTIKRRY